MAWEDVEVDLDDEMFDAPPDMEEERYFDTGDGPDDQDVDWVARLGERDEEHPFGRVTGGIRILERDEDDLPELRLSEDALSVVTGSDARQARLERASQARRARLEQARAGDSHPVRSTVVGPALTPSGGPAAPARALAGNPREAEFGPGRADRHERAATGVRGRHRVVGESRAGAPGRTGRRQSTGQAQEWIPGGPLPDVPDGPSFLGRALVTLLLAGICVGLFAAAIMYGARIYEQSGAAPAPATSSPGSLY